MNVHPGDVIRWQGESHQVVAIRSTYLTLRAVDGDEEEVEVLAADLRYQAEPAAPVSLRSLLDLRSLQGLDARERKTVDVWLE